MKIIIFISFITSFSAIAQYGQGQMSYNPYGSQNGGMQNPYPTLAPLPTYDQCLVFMQHDLRLNGCSMDAQGMEVSCPDGKVYKLDSGVVNSDIRETKDIKIENKKSYAPKGAQQE